MPKMRETEPKPSMSVQTMPLRHVLVRRLTAWLTVWLLLCLSAVYLMGQSDVQREYREAQNLVGQLQKALYKEGGLSELDLMSVQASLAQGKAQLERQETRRELFTVGGMLVLMALGSGLVVWMSLRPVLNRPLAELVDRLSAYVNQDRGDRQPFNVAGKHRVAELYTLEASVQTLIKTLESEQQRSTALLQQVYNIQEKERARIAQDLHDHFGQMLTSICVNSAFMSKRAGESLKDTSQAIHDQAQEMMAWLRSSLADLKPHVLLEVSVREAALDWTQTWGERNGWFVDFAWEERCASLPSPLDITVFRVIQEAITNAARHSNGKNISLMAGLDPETNEFVLMIRNPCHSGATEGGSESDDAQSIQPSLGLLGVQERLLAFNGRARWDRIQGEFVLTCRLPLPAASLATQSRTQTHDSPPDKPQGTLKS